MILYFICLLKDEFSKKVWIFDAYQRLLTYPRRKQEICSN